MDSVESPSSIGKVVVALPTTASARYIGRSMRRMAPELRELAEARETVLAVCLNGPDPDGAHRGALTAALDELSTEIPKLTTQILVREPAGKNAAFGELVGYAKSVDAAYMLVVDDDVIFAPGTLARNVEALERSATDRIVVVGARILAPERPLRTFLKDRRWFPAAVWAWWCQCIFRLPYEPASEFFLFTPGPCSAMRVASIRSCPPTSPASPTTPTSTIGWCRRAVRSFNRRARSSTSTSPRGTASGSGSSCASWPEWSGPWRCSRSTPTRSAGCSRGRTRTTRTPACPRDGARHAVCCCSSATGWRRRICYGTTAV